MKLFKKVLSLIIVLVILATSTIAVFAQDISITKTYADEEPDLLRETMYLAFYANDYLTNFALMEHPAPGARPLHCVAESGEEFLRLTEEVHELHDRVYYGEETSMDEINNYYRKLDESVAKIIINNIELEWLITFCKLEKNNNSYYPEIIWNDFQEKLFIAEQVNNDYKDTIEVSNAYWDLLFAHNKLCICNTTPGDIDFDGTVTVFDATIVQMILADLYNLNSSQLYVLDKYTKSRISVIDATEIQRFLAKITNELSDGYLSSLIENTEYMDIDENVVFDWYRFAYLY